MFRTLAPPLCTVLGLTLSACAQQGTDFMPGTGASGHSTPAPAAAPGPLAAQRASTLIGLPVQSSSGMPLGVVQDIVFAGGGRASHLIIVYGSNTGSAGKLTAIPWAVAMADIHNGALVLDAKRLAGAPDFAPGQWPDLGDASWSTTADTYWGGVPAAARTLTPIDSTSRSRSRTPPRD